MIIIEGADGTGKTTVGEALSECLKAPLIHSPSGAAIQDKMQWVLSMLNLHCARPDKLVIYDRFYFSEFVYGPILRGGIAYPQWFIETVQQVFLPEVQPVIVFCDTSDENARRGLTSREQLAGVKKNISRILEDYRALMLDQAPVKQRALTIRYDWTSYKTAKEDIIPAVEYLLEVRRLTAVVEAMKERSK